MTCDEMIGWNDLGCSEARFARQYPLTLSTGKTLSESNNGGTTVRRPKDKSWIYSVTTIQLQHFIPSCAVSSAATTVKAISPRSDLVPLRSQSSKDTEAQIGQDVTWPRTPCWFTSDWPSSVLVSHARQVVFRWAKD